MVVKGQPSYKAVSKTFSSGSGRVLSGQAMYLSQFHVLLRMPIPTYKKYYICRIT